MSITKKNFRNLLRERVEGLKKNEQNAFFSCDMNMITLSPTCKIVVLNELKHNYSSCKHFIEYENALFYMCSKCNQILTRITTDEQEISLLSCIGELNKLSSKSRKRIIKILFSDTVLEYADRNS